jgi:hypothetical protein
MFRGLALFLSRLSSECLENEEAFILEAHNLYRASWSSYEFRSGLRRHLWKTTRQFKNAVYMGGASAVAMALPTPNLLKIQFK